MKHPLHYICLTSFLLSYLVLPHFLYLTFIVPCHALFFLSYLAIPRFTYLTLPYPVILILPCLTYFSYITFILPCFLTFLISPSSSFFLSYLHLTLLYLVFLILHCHTPFSLPYHRLTLSHLLSHLSYLHLASFL